MKVVARSDVPMRMREIPKSPVRGRVGERGGEREREREREERERGRERERERGREGRERERERERGEGEGKGTFNGDNSLITRLT